MTISWQDRANARRRAIVAAHCVWLNEHLADKRCADCGEHAPDIFEFDHRHGEKRCNVSKAVHNGYSRATLQAEIAKCDILCPNCHRRRTHADQGSYIHRYLLGEIDTLDALYARVSPGDARHTARRRSALKNQHRNRMDNIAYLQSHPCVDCDETDIRVLEYDHVRGEKIAELWLMVKRGNSLAIIEAERAKCEVRCANCHRRASHNNRSIAA